MPAIFRYVPSPLGFLVCLMMFTALLSVSAQAQTTAQPIVKNIAKAFAVEQRNVFEGSQKVINHAVVLSGIRKVNGQWRAEETQVFNGELFKQTLEFQPQNIDNITQSLQTYIRSLGLEEVFHCQGLVCGGSHGWANAILDNRLLYGRDAKQHYWAWRAAGASKLDPWYVAYLVERGNRRIYLEWQVATPHAGAIEQAKELAGQWQAKGYASLPHEASAVDAVMLAAIQYWLEATTPQILAVVGHNREASKFLQTQQSLSLRSAESITDLLRDRFATVEWQPYGLGGLAPRATTSQSRYVELVPLSVPTNPR